MNKFWLVIVLMTLIIQLSGQIPELNIWNNIRNSSYTQEDQIYIRCETVDLPIIQTDLYYYFEDQWIQTDMDNLTGLTIEGSIEASHQDDMICRFKTYGDSLVAMMPAYVSEDVFPPAIDQLSLIIDDAAGDTLSTGPEQLDILGTYFGFSDTRFYVAIKNNGSGFPTNEGGIFPSEYYVYISALVNPEIALIDTAGYALVYVEVPLFFQPGLYRFAGSEISLDSIQQIAEIETAVVDSFLYLACNIEDMVNDEYFGEWPSLSRTLGIDFLTAVVGITPEFEFIYSLIDFSIPAIQVIDQYVIEPFVNELPVISNISAEISDGITGVELTYEDNNGNFPLIAHVITDQNETFDLLPTSFDFTQPVIFQAQIPVSNWNSLNVFFSDNGFEYVEEVIYNSSVDDGSISMNTILQNYPNPFNPSTAITFSLPVQEAENAELIIFNVKGQLVKDLSENLKDLETSGDNELEYSVLWNGEDESGCAVPSGLYFYKLEYGSHKLTSKMLLLK
jgi:hypothetical protein